MEPEKKDELFRQGDHYFIKNVLKANMEFPQFGTLAEGQDFLSNQFNRLVTRSEFFNAVVTHGLRLFAATPKSARIVTPSGRIPFAVPHQTAGWRMALLRRRSAMELWVHNKTTSTCPAWEPGDQEFFSWDAIKARRAEMNYYTYTRDTWPYGDWDEGEFLGESDIFSFDKPIHVSDETLRIPRETIEELVQFFRQKNAKVASDQADINDVSSTGITASAAVRGITKEQVLIAFEHLVKINLKDALSNGKGLFGDAKARVQKGKPGSRYSKDGKHIALWNPTILSVGLLDEYHVPELHLKKAFHEHEFLADWREEWTQTCRDQT